MAAILGRYSRLFAPLIPGEEIPEDHPFARRHKLSGKPAAAQLPPKFYILDMFPYPSGAGLHVGHPEGYTATDILARYKRALGFNVLHPMGWDAFGLPAEQYAVKTGQHPRQTTEANIATFKRQIQSLGFSYDWSRELATTDPDYFKWTQWIFLKLYNSWFNPETNKAEPIETLKYPAELESQSVGAASSRADPGTARQQPRPTRTLESDTPHLSRFQTSRLRQRSNRSGGANNSAPFWPTKKSWMAKAKSAAFRLSASRCANGCSASPPTPKNCSDDLDTIDWSDSLKEMQRNWIGRSEGAEVDFEVVGSSRCDDRTRSAGPYQQNSRVHHAPGYFVRSDLHGARAGTQLR